MRLRSRLTAKELLPSREDYEDCGAPYVPARKAGYADSEPGESGYKWAIFSRRAVEDAFGFVIDQSDDLEALASNLTGWGRSYNGPGRRFASEPSIRVFKRNILVKQFTGLDI
jgi:hypothetical protein